MIDRLANFVLFQLHWFVAVIGTANGHAWLGPAWLLLFAAWQLHPRHRARGDALLMAIAMAVGTALDSTMAATGLLAYAAPGPSTSLAPLWIISLWGGVGLALNHCLAWLTWRPRLAVLLAMLLGPLSYHVAGRGWSVVAFADPFASTFALLGLSWGVAFALLCLAARRLRQGTTASPLVREEPAK
jgi:hypothetical protein